MSRSYNPKPWEDKSGVAFVDNGLRSGGEVVRVRQTVSRAPERSAFAEMRDDWNVRRPYYIIMFITGSIIALALSLLIYAFVTS